MNKTELISAVAEQAELSKKDAEKALKAFTDVIAAELVKGEKVQLVGFGTFEVSEREAREGRNPLTGEKITIAASKNPKFKAGKALKDMVNAKFCFRNELTYKFDLIATGHVNPLCDANVRCGGVIVSGKTCPPGAGSRNSGGGIAAKRSSYAVRQISESIPYHQAENRGKRGVRQRSCHVK